MDNIQLYESGEVIAKYASNTTRANSLNIPEKNVIDKFLQQPQKILEVGCGTGRLAANLYLYGHDVKGVDLSVGMIKKARDKFPLERFPELSFENDDAITLANQESKSYDTVFYTMNGIDYIENVKDRYAAISSAYRVLKDNGLFIFSSHNHKAYVFSYKDIRANPLPERIKYFMSGNHFRETVREEENVVGGGNIWKSSPEHIICRTESLGFEFLDYAVDARTRIDNRISRSMNISTYIFDYFLYVFRKNISTIDQPE